MSTLHPPSQPLDSRLGCRVRCRGARAHVPLTAPKHRAGALATRTPRGGQRGPECGGASPRPGEKRQHPGLRPTLGTSRRHPRSGGEAEDARAGSAVTSGGVEGRCCRRWPLGPRPTRGEHVAVQGPGLSAASGTHWGSRDVPRGRGGTTALSVPRGEDPRQGTKSLSRRVL